MRGAELRVRPVVMTSLTAALGLLPAALANSIGSQAQKPLAIVVVGGMLVDPLPDPLPHARPLQLLPRTSHRAWSRRRRIRWSRAPITRMRSWGTRVLSIEGKTGAGASSRTIGRESGPVP